MAEYPFQLHHVAIQTADIQKSARFYEKVLGMHRLKEEQSPKGRTIIWIDSGAGRIELYSGKPGQPLKRSWDPNQVGPLSIGFWVPDLDTAVRTLLDQKVSFIKLPYEPVPGERAAMVEGPDGEEIVLLEKKVSSG
ncbi:MAG TPA: VOC family protein [Candidatus Manganitrophaceae bacterium]|nr:VOC family protein [Candidatus Manganitrophaceae bacterium]